MAGKREKPEEIVSKFQQVEVLHDARMAGSVTLRRGTEVASERQLWAGFDTDIVPKTTTSCPSGGSTA